MHEMCPVAAPFVKRLKIYTRCLSFFPDRLREVKVSELIDPYANLQHLELEAGMIYDSEWYFRWPPRARSNDTSPPAAVSYIIENHFLHPLRPSAFPLPFSKPRIPTNDISRIL
jgi:hypothetical protein